MKILNAKIVSDKEMWIKIWEKWPNREVFAHPNYLSLYLDENIQAYCAVLEDQDKVIFYPFLLRNLQSEPYYEASMGDVYDIITAYGYGGVYMYGNGNLDSFLKQFYIEFEEWAVEKGIVSEFIRFALNLETREAYPGIVELNNNNVIVDLTIDKDEMWHNFKHKVRKNVHKAEKEGLTVLCDKCGNDLEAFLGIYYGTMERREADKGYYFPQEYFEMINSQLGGQFVYFHVMFQEKVISTELVLVSEYNIYSFLGGTKEAYFDLRPNDFLKYAIINWGKENGKKRFVLGGGHIPFDGIYNYKLGFAPNGECPFYVGKRVLNQKIYDILVQNKMNLCIREGNVWNTDTTFFPLYRVKV